ncbi:poly(3-hydroxybutyrate) depolymerase [Corynebacterium sp. sy017]|uniref:alpha/beta hydrolase family esterase n=1 Tax=unclassified Corynebacterium TaxID=2624378 RepID=UPI0011860F8F|nr:MULTISPECIES: PHB depolymerase family esterase [unclassified Corynebacterium]MBP3089274.1 poly(3-hydroxybutyrate) depolymerase [Corynebacterium sp. sy017]TSD91021.1 poly(3-hydroxybutyrate) depolymerase [Corynebacterium sp. SY003]
MHKRRRRHPSPYRRTKPRRYRLYALFIGILSASVSLILFETISASRSASTTAQSSQEHDNGNATTQARKFPPNPSVLPGEMRQLSLVTAAGTERQYYVSVPTHYDLHSPKKTPVFFVLHGWKSTPKTFVEGDIFKGNAGQEALIVLPLGIDESWASAPYSVTTVDEDISFLHQILSQLAGEYNVDNERIYAAGLSNGGGLVAQLGCRDTQTFAAIATVSAAYYQYNPADCTPEGIPALAVHGTDDDVIHYNGGRRHGDDYFSVEEIADMYAERNKCRMDEFWQEKLNERDIAFTYDGCQHDTALLKIIGGKHEWPQYAGETEYIWEFLSKQRLAKRA